MKTLVLVALACCCGSAQQAASPIPVTTTEARGYWTDSTAGLMWAASDNGSGVTWSQAVRYCRTLALAGYRDWTLPDIDTLQRLFGGPANSRGYHVQGPVKITGWAWSRSPGADAGEAWALDFGDGARASVVMGDSGLNRALCVRQAAPAH